MWNICRIEFIAVAHVCESDLWFREKIQFIVDGIKQRDQVQSTQSSGLFTDVGTQWSPFYMYNNLSHKYVRIVREWLRDFVHFSQDTKKKARDNINCAVSYFFFVVYKCCWHYKQLQRIVSIQLLCVVNKFIHIIKRFVPCIPYYGSSEIIMLTDQFFFSFLWLFSSKVNS